MLDEIQLRYAQGFRVIDFEDDNLTFYKNEFRDLCRELIKRYPQGELEFVAMNGISYISLDDELLQLMKLAGFTSLNLALVSSDKSVRDSTKRPHTVEKYLSVVAKGFELGFNMVSYQILGLPNETLTSMIQTLCFNTALPVLLGASPYYQTPNAPIAANVAFSKADLIKARLTAFAIETENFSRDDLYTLFITTRIFNFIKGMCINADSDLLDLINTDSRDHRESIGLELLAQLLSSKHLHFYTRKETIINRHFKTQLFAEILENLTYINTLSGQRIYTQKFHQQLIQANMVKHCDENQATFLQSF